MILLLGRAWAADDGGSAPAAEDIEEIEVTTEKPADTATGRELDRADVQAFPARSADELLRAVPGLHLSAHGGNGKAFQFLVRGFDAEHGSDLVVTVEGVPLNEPSNVHGQGYLDLHFLPTVLVDGLSLVKGSYRAEDGDFAITGSADYRVGLEPEGMLVATRAGTDRSGAGTFAWRPRGRGPGSFVVLEGEGGLGVGEGRRYAMLRAATGLDGDLGAAHVRAMAFAYDGTFDSPGVLRLDDLTDGSVGFYDAYPVAGGGHSSRVLGIAEVDVPGARTGGRAVAWAGGRALTLDQNFTGFYADPVHGDGTRQAEQAGDGGARAEVVRVVEVLDQSWALRAGADARGSLLSESEQGLTVDRAPWEDRLRSDVRQTDAAGWAEGRLVFGRALTLVPGLRADRVDLWLRDHLDALGAPITDPTYAHSGATVLAPKCSASLRPVEPLTLYGAYGRGFRSPHARGIADGDLAPVMKSDSVEAGAKLVPAPAIELSATGFEIVVSDELVFDHTRGRFLSAGRTRRLGVEAVADLHPAPWLRLEGDVTYTDGRFTATDEAIPYAPRWLVAGGAFVQGARTAGGRLTGGVRAWYLGPRPLPSGFASHPALVGSLTGRLDWRTVTLGLDVDDLFVGHWRDGEFVYPSWFDRSEPRSELQMLHVTAGDPFAVRLTLGLRPSFPSPPHRG